jgi:LemA protein
MKKVLIFVVLAVIVLGFWGMSVNNSLVGDREEVRKAWANVESQYQRRSDLVPNLVSTVRGAANFEQETLTAVVEARSKATSIQMNADDLNDPAAMQRFQEAQGELTGSLSRLLVAVEAYPELKANANFRDLQVQLEGTENRIATERNRYNEVVSGYNTKVQKFPTSMMAGMLGFKASAYFEADTGTERAPTVNFD